MTLREPDPMNSNGDHKRSDYEEKFADFIRMLVDTPEQVVIIHHPEVIGDTFDAIVESLNRLADTKKSLMIVPRSER
jgi:hypothetical protein